MSEYEIVKHQYDVVVVGAGSNYVNVTPTVASSPSIEIWAGAINCEIVRNQWLVQAAIIVTYVIGRGIIWNGQILCVGFWCDKIS